LRTPSKAESTTSSNSSSMRRRVRPRVVPLAHVVGEDRQPHAAGAQRAVVVEQRLVRLKRRHQPVAVAVEVDRAAEDLTESGGDQRDEVRLAHLPALQGPQRRLRRARGDQVHRLAQRLERDAEVRVRALERLGQWLRDDAAEVADDGQDHAWRMTS
jgi:hypothetical protein